VSCYPGQQAVSLLKKENKHDSDSVNRRWHRSMPSLKSTAVIRRPITRVCDKELQ